MIPKTLICKLSSILFGIWNKDLIYSEQSDAYVEAYIDADWIGSVDERRSISRYCTLMGGNLVTCRSKKQSVAATLSSKVEYRTMD